MTREEFVAFVEAIPNGLSVHIEDATIANTGLHPWYIQRSDDVWCVYSPALVNSYVLHHAAAVAGLVSGVAARNTEDLIAARRHRIKFEEVEREA